MQKLNQRRDPFWRCQEILGKKSHVTEKSSKTKSFVLSSNEKAFKTMVPKGGTLWKHPTLLSSKIGMPIEIL